MPGEAAFDRTAQTPEEQPQEEHAPSSERRRKPSKEELSAAEDALARVRRDLETEQEMLPEIAQQEALAATATMRAKLIRGESEDSKTNPDRAWQLLHELHAYEFDLEAALDAAKEYRPYVRGTDLAAMSRWSLEDALDEIRSTIRDIRPSVHSVAARMMEEESHAAGAHKTFWEDARETRGRLDTGGLSADERSRLTTLFKERAAQVETEHTLLQERAMESRSSEDRRALEDAGRALAELHAALFALEKAERTDVEGRTREASATESEEDPWRVAQEKKLKRIIREQKKLEGAIESQYGATPEELIARGGTGLRGMLGRLVGYDNSFEKWKELDRQREAIATELEPALQEYLPGKGTAKARARKTALNREKADEKWKNLEKE